MVNAASRTTLTTETAYFDTNVYGHILNRVCVTDEQVSLLRTAVREGRLRILASDVNIDEIVAAFASNPTEATERLRLLLELTDLESDLLKPQNELLLEDIRAYAERRPLPRRRLDLQRARTLSAGLKHLIDEGKLSPDLQAALEEGRVQKESFKAGMTEARGNIVGEWEAISEEALAQAGKTGMRKSALVPDFERYRGPVSGGFIKWVVKRAGRQKACARRGLGGLRQAKTVAMFGDSSASWVYGQTFEERTPNFGDSGDLIHAVLATSADVFVTCDKQLRRILDRVPRPGLRVVDLPEFVAGYAPSGPSSALGED